MADLLDPLADEFRFDGTNGEAVVLIHGFTGVPGKNSISLDTP